MSGPFSAPFTAGAFLAGRALLEKLYFLFVISAAVGSAVTCAHVVLTTKRSSGETQPDSHLIIETRVRRLNALFTVALVASAAFVIDGVLNCSLVRGLPRSRCGHSARASILLVDDADLCALAAGDGSDEVDRLQRCRSSAETASLIQNIFAAETCRAESTPRRIAAESHPSSSPTCFR